MDKLNGLKDVVSEIETYKSLIDKFEKRRGNLPDHIKNGTKVQFSRYGRLTNALLLKTDKQGEQYVAVCGEALRLPTDPEKPQVGRNIALWNAFEKIRTLKRRQPWVRNGG